MKFRFKNIGPIEKAELELGDLTIIAGHNNTGKTYLVYTLYGFLKGFRELLLGKAGSRFIKSHFEKMVSLSMDELVSTLIAEGQVEWQVEESFLIEEQARLIQEMTREFSKHRISGVFNTSQGQFEDSSLEFEFSSKIPLHLRHLFPLKTGSSLTIGYDGTKFDVLLNNSEPVSDSKTEPLVTKQVFELICLLYLFPGAFESAYRPFILSSARHSIPLFTNELDYVRSQVVRLLQQQEDEHNGESIFGSDPLSNTSRYALPIHDNIDFSRSIPGQAERNDNKPKNVFPDDLERMMGGYFTSINGDLRFFSSADNSLDFDIPLHLASSSAWEMSIFYFFLGYFMDSESSYLLIIDEPESHLDTANQIQFARLLARLVNSGVKVLITTHSDYIIKEINNLIMLHSGFEDKDEILEEFGYKADDHLDPGVVRSYIAEKETLTPCEIDEFGMAMSVFDETINSINRAASKIATRKVLEAEGE